MKKFAILLAISLVLLITILIYQKLSSSDHMLHIVFCNVGQGDAIYIKTSSRRHILYDGGPDKSVLSCLQKHQAFWQRTIDILFLSHPHSDHFAGLYFVIDRYNVLSFNTEKLNNQSLQFRSFLIRVDQKKIAKKDLLAGDVFRLKDGVTIRVLGPRRAYLAATSPGGTIGERSEFANLILLVSYGSFDLLLTGDSQIQGLENAVGGLSKGTIDVLQVPHHGSVTGLDDRLLDKIAPQLAVISVGKNNYGHPSSKIVNILRDKDIKILRTDKDADVEIVSDGKKWWVM